MIKYFCIFLILGALVQVLFKCEGPHYDENQVAKQLYEEAHSRAVKSVK